MPLNNVNKIGVSGHRILVNPEYARKSIKEFLEKELKIHSEMVVISALAEGVDTIFVEEAIKLGIPFEVILPFPVEAYQETFSDSNSKIKLLELLKMTTSVKTILSLEPTDKEVRRQAYLDCGKKIVDDCNQMLFAFDGKDAQGKGGTGDVFLYSNSKRKKYNYLFLINANDPQSSEMNELKSNLDTSYGRIKDTEKTSRTKYEKSWMRALIFGFAAALLFGLNTGLGKYFIDIFSIVMQYVEILSLGFGLFFFYKLEKRKDNISKDNLKIERLRSRRDKEVVKYAQIYFNHGLEVFPLATNITPTYQSEFVSSLLSCLQENRAYVHQNWELQKNFFLNDLMGGGGPSTDQIKYHGNQVRTASKKLKTWHHRQLFIFGLLILSSVGHFIMAVAAQTHWNIPYHEFLHGLLTTVTIISTACLGAIEAYLYFKDYKRIIANSTFMLSYFKLKKSEIEALKNLYSDNIEQQKFLSIAKEIRERMDWENLSWFMVNEAVAAKL